MNNFDKKIEKIASLYPKEIGSDKIVGYIKFGLEVLQKKYFNQPNSWLGKRINQEQCDDLVSYFGTPNLDGIEPEKVIEDIVSKLFDGGIPNWRDPGTMYNICTPVNVVSNAIQCISNEMNIHNISSDFAGAAAVSEKAVNKIFSKIIGNEKLFSFFTFGGTATNMYAFKIALNRHNKHVSMTGLKGNEYFAVTEHAHFSHKSVADWLGIGLDKLITIKADKDGRSIVEDFEQKASKIIESGGILVGIILNGGPFYNFAVDPISDFVSARDRIMSKHNLDYAPHIHVDSVITWVWLFFSGYSFEVNDLGIPSEVLQVLKEQYSRISEVTLADSFGVDFHKAFGGCAAPCSLFCLNNGEHAEAISKSGRGIDTHHLGNVWALTDMSDITLETTRSASAPLAALSILKTLGLNGMRVYVAHQMVVTMYMRKLEQPGLLCANVDALGFNTMIIAIPKAYQNKIKTYADFLVAVNTDQLLLDESNSLLNRIYLKSFEAKRLGCSFSKSFALTNSGTKISGLKYTIVSPHTNAEIIKNEFLTLQKLLVSCDKS